MSAPGGEYLTTSDDPEAIAEARNEAADESADTAAVVSKGQYTTVPTTEMTSISPTVATTPQSGAVVINVRPTPAANTASLSPNAASGLLDKPPLKTSGSSEKGAADYARYVEVLKSAWKDMLDITIEYRDLAYVRRVPVQITEITTVPTALINNLALWRSSAQRDFAALTPTSGVIQPGTMTLVLAPPGHGKSTFLKALTGRYHNDSLLRGKIFYNGLTYAEAGKRGLNVNKLTSYVDQGDIHLSLLTVRETFQFALDNAVADPKLLEDPEIIRLHAKKVDLMIDLLGLRECENTIIGNDMIRGVSGGQKRRVTIGEMMITNARAFFLDEITTGLDSAASFDILNALRNWTRLMGGSIVSALLQPTPECFDLFDRLILLRQGSVIYDGPLNKVADYFDSIGIPVPNDQDLADFLTDFLSDPKLIYFRNLYKRARRAEQQTGGGSSTLTVQGEAPAYTRTTEAELKTPEAQSGDVVVPVNSPGFVQPTVPLGSSRGGSSRRHNSVATLKNEVIAPNTSNVGIVPLTTQALIDAFRASPYYAETTATLKQLEADRSKLSNIDVTTMTPYSRAQYGSSYSRSWWDYLAANTTRQWWNVSRNVSFYAPRLGQSVFIGLVLGSLFWQLQQDNYAPHFGLFLFACVFIAFGNMAELPFAAEAKLVIFKQVDAGFYPTVPYVVSVLLIHMLLAISETAIFGTIIYFMAGFTLDAGRFFFYLLVLISTNLAMSTLFRTISYLTRSPDIAEQSAGPLTGLSMFFGGFLITYNNIPRWLIWAYEMSPFTWAFRSLSLNEYEASRYSSVVIGPDGVPETQGEQALKLYQIDTTFAYKWAGVGYLLGFFLFFSGVSAAALAYKRFPLTIGTRRNFDEEEESNDVSDKDTEVKGGQPISMRVLAKYASSFRAKDSATALPFEPVTLSWRNIKYTVRVKKDDKTVDRLLLNDVSGFAEAGTLTALMGSSGAGKTTLMDVIAGRKTAGVMEGEILVNGFPKQTKTFNRLVGYVEQTDIHLATQTVREALRFSARLRLPREVPDEQMFAFVEEVMEILELKSLADRLVGDVAAPSLSPGQLKRVTIGVELVANPPILFLDEPTSGLDSRAALIVMRVVKRIAQTGRAVLCTIHQPSADLFYNFDRLLLLKSGGIDVFFGDIGEDGADLVSYFENAPIPQGSYRPVKPPRANPASWMLDVIGAGTGAKLKAQGISKDDLADYAAIYKSSKLREDNMRRVEELSKPQPGREQVQFNSVYAASYLQQYYYVIHRHFQYYWRNTQYTLTRFAVITFLGLVVGLLYQDVGESSQDKVISKIAAIFVTAGFPGVVVAASSLPILNRQRSVFYRETASYTYAKYSYSTALTVVEIVYTSLSALAYLIPYYFLVGFVSTAEHFFKYLLSQIVCMLCWAYLGQFLVAALPNVLVANIFNGLIATFFFLFGGIFIQAGSIPKGWKWFYYLDLMARQIVGLTELQLTCSSDNPDACQCIPVQGLSTPDGICPAGQERVQDYAQDVIDAGWGEYWPMVGYTAITAFVFKICVDLAIVFISWQNR